MIIPGAGQMQALFAAQFELIEGGYVYRNRSKGPPIRVSTEEKAAFVKAFDRWLIGGFAMIVVGTLTILGWAVLESAASGAGPTDVEIWIALGVLCAAYLCITMWAWNAPARALEGRLPIGQALTAQEALRRDFAQMPWISFPLAAGAAIAFYFKVTGGRELLTGWNILWGLLVVTAVGFVGFQAYRKWRFSRTDAA
jgi:hypothetical protein